MTRFFYDYWKHLQEKIQVNFFLNSWNKLDLDLLTWFKRFCLLREFSSLDSIFHLILMDQTVSFWVMDFSGYMPSSGIAGSYIF